MFSSVVVSLPSVTSLSETVVVYKQVLNFKSYFLNTQVSLPESSIRDNTYLSASSENLSITELTNSSLQEQQSDNRFTRAMNCVFKYDFKVGNYLPDDAKKLNPHLFMTMKDITTGIRKSS